MKRPKRTGLAKLLQRLMRRDGVIEPSHRLSWHFGRGGGRRGVVISEPDEPEIYMKKGRRR